MGVVQPRWNRGRPAVLCRHPGREILPRGENDRHLWWLFETSADAEDSCQGCYQRSGRPHPSRAAPIHEPALQEFTNAVHLCRGCSRPSRCLPRYTFFREVGRELVAEAVNHRALDSDTRAVGGRPPYRPRAARCSQHAANHNPPDESVERDGTPISSESSAFARCVGARAGRSPSSRSTPVHTVGLECEGA